MATGGKFSGSLSKGCYEFFNYCCMPCSNQDEIVEDCYWRWECDEYLCRKCYDYHSKLGATSCHKVIGKDKIMGKVTGSKSQKQLPTERCEVHRKQSIEIYCADHDVICTTCGGKTYIVDAAKGVKSGKLLKTTRGHLTAALKEIKKGKDTRQKDLEALCKDNAARVKHVRGFTEKLIERIRELERSTVDEINVKHKGLSAETVADIAALDDMISVVDNDLRLMDQPDFQVFVDINDGQDHHEVDGRMLLRQVTRPRQAGFKLDLNKDIENFLNESRSLLATLVDDYKVYKATLSGSYNVKIREDTTTCIITGSCLLPDGTIVLADYNNNRLKRLDTSYRATDHYDMGSEPFGVTRTAPGEIAVTMINQKKVQFVSTGASMSLTRSFSTSDRCRGLCYSKGELFVSCGGSTSHEEGPGHVAVYDLSGTSLRTVQTNPSGQNIFSCPLYISIISDGNRVYVTDVKAGIVSLDRTGKGGRSISDPSLKTAHDVCILDNGHILVCGGESDNMLQFDGDGRKMTELLTTTDGVKGPRSLCYDGNRSTLVVTMNNTIKVFDVV